MRRNAEGLEPRSKTIEVAREEPVAVVEDSGVVDHVEEEGTSGLDLLGRLEDGAERDGLAAGARRSQIGLETLVDGKELVHPGEASRGQPPRDEEKVDVGVLPLRASPHRAEDRAGDEALPVEPPDLTDRPLQEPVVAFL